MKDETLRFCRSCGAVFLGKRWQQDISLEKAVVAVLESIGYRDFSVRDMAGAAGSIRSGKRKVGLELQPGKKKRTDKVFINIDQAMCNVCSRAKSGYYEGILQLRNRMNPDFEKVVLEVYEKVGERNDVFIAKAVESKPGIDIYISSNRFLAGLGKWLNDSYGGELKSSKKLFSRSHETGKEIYRTTVLVRLPDFSAGDIIMAGKRYMLVRAVRSKAVSGSDLRTGKNVKVPYSKPQKVIPRSRFREAVVSRTRPHLEVLHPDTYQATRVENERKITGDRVNVVEIEKKIYLV